MTTSRGCDGTNAMKDEEHEVLPSEGGTMRDNATNRCDKGQHHERGRGAVGLGTTKGAKTKKKRGVTGSGDG